MAQTITVLRKKVEFPPLCAVCCRPNPTGHYQIVRCFRGTLLVRLYFLGIPMCRDHAREAGRRNAPEWMVELLGWLLCGGLTFYALADSSLLALWVGLWIGGFVHYGVSPRFASAKTKKLRNCIRITGHDRKAGTLDLTIEDEPFARLTKSVPKPTE